MDQQYEEIQPQVNWLEDNQSNTLVIDAPGFNREQFRIQLNPTGSLKISGQRQVDGSKSIWFTTNITIPKNSNVQAIRAKFDKGILTVIIPKLITEATKPVPPVLTTPLPKEELKAQEAQTVGKESTSPTPIPQRKEPTLPKEMKDQTEEAQKPTHKQNGTTDNGLPAERKKEVQSAENGKQEHDGPADEEGNREGKRMVSGGLFKRDDGPIDSVGGLKDGLGNEKQLLVNVLVSGLVVLGLGMYLINKFRTSPGEN